MSSDMDDSDSESKSTRSSWIDEIEKEEKSMSSVTQKLTRTPKNEGRLVKTQKTVRKENTTQDMDIEQDDEQSFTHPKKVAKIGDAIKKVTTTEIKNRYTPIANLEPEIKQNENTKTKQRKRFMPPIVIQGEPTTHKTLIQKIKEDVKGEFYIKYAPKSFLLYLKDNSDYVNYKNMLENSQTTQFHTYTPREKKQHAFVLRGLQAITETDDIEQELMEEHGLKTNKIYMMKNTKNPLFLVITDQDVTLKTLQMEIKYLFHTKITWERRRNERTITQCRRCQVWGHATTNCHRTPKCVKCGDSHWTKDCEKSRETPPKCANCGGAHTACNTDCPIYKKKMELTTRPVTRQTTYIAPVPRTNVWTERQKERLNPSTENSGQERLRTETTRQTEAPSTTQNNDFTDFKTLTQELNKLNQKIKEAIRAIMELNRMLEKVHDPMQIIVVMQEFTASVLPNFNIAPLSSSG